MSTGQNIGKIEHAYFTGTTSVVTNGGAAIKNVLPTAYTGAYLNYIDVVGTGASVYLENANSPRDGLNFPTAVVEIDGGNPVATQIIRLTDSKYVVLSNETNLKLEATVVTTQGTVPTLGQTTQGTHEYYINNGDTDSWRACPIGTAGTHFAVIFRDTADSGYVKGIICSVAGTVITLGDEKTLGGTDVGTEVAGQGYGICEPRAGVLYFAWELAANTLTSVAAPYSGVTIGTLGTQLAVDASACTEISCCDAGDNKVFVLFADTDTYMKARVATVSAAGVIGTYGTLKVIGTNVAATEMECASVAVDKVAIGFIDALGDPSVQVCTIATTTITAGTAVVAEACTGTDTGICMRDPDRGFLKYDDGTTGKVVSFSISTTTVAFDASIDNFCETATAGGGTHGMVYAGNNQVVITYEDSANDHAILIGTYFENRIIDVRSATASIAYTGKITPNFSRKETLAKI